MSNTPTGNRRPLLAALSLASTFLVGGPTSAQIVFEKTYGTTSRDVGNVARQTADGGYIFVGFTETAANGDDILLIRILPDGTEDWSVTIGGGGRDHGQSVRQTPDGGFAIIGWTESVETDKDVYLVKTDADGTVMWDEKYGGVKEDRGFSIEPTLDGGFILAGSTRSESQGQADLWLIKVDDEGEHQWDRKFGGSAQDEAKGQSLVRQTPDGGFIVGGFTHSFGQSSQAYLIRTDANGNPIWEENFGSSASEGLASLVQTTDNGCIAAGSYRSSPLDQVLLMKTDASGGAQWDLRYEFTPHEDKGNAVVQTADGGYVVAGVVGEQSSVASADVLLMKTDAAGQILWTRIYGGAGLDHGIDLQQAADGGFLISGFTDSSGEGLLDFYLIKTCLDGTLDAPCDADGDGETDELDNCPLAHNADQADFDLDGLGDPCDCDPFDADDPTPDEVLDLAFADKETILWAAVASADGYRVLRGSVDDLPVGPGGGGEVCFDEQVDASLKDGSVPASGTGFWYLARAHNPCGGGPLGQVRGTGTCS